MPESPRRVGLVTGASRGIGAAVAVALARRGVHVVLTARSQAGLEETDDAVRAAGGTATLLPMDLTDTASLDALGPSLFERFRRLDVLVSNAGALGVLTPVAHILPRDWAEVVGVNITANWRLIRGCAPLLLAAEAGRAVFLTSIRASEPRAYWGAYGATQAAMQNLALTWAHEVATTRLKVNLYDPGPVATRLRATAMPGEDPASISQPAHVAVAVADLCEPSHAGHAEILRASAH